MAKKKTIKEVQAEVVRDPESEYQACLEKAVQYTQSLQLGHLDYYWQIGELVVSYIEYCGDEHSRAGLERLAHDLQTRIPGATFGITTLYCARSIHLSYKREDLTPMVHKGVVIGHLKILNQFDDDSVKAQITSKMYGPDGKAISVKELDELVQQHRKESAKKSVEVALDKVKADKAPAPVKPTPPKGGAVQDHEPDSDAPDAGQPETAGPPKPDDGKTGSRGATPTKEFSQSPLKVLKGIDNVAIKLVAQAGDVFIAINEAVKVGFDSDRAQENYKLAFSSAQSSLIEVQEVVTKLVAEMASLSKEA
jgi:hypothetical protein